MVSGVSALEISYTFIVELESAVRERFLHTVTKFNIASFILGHNIIMRIGTITDVIYYSG